MVHFRLVRYEEAVAGLDAALSTRPDREASRYLRGVALKRLGRTKESAEDLAIARHLQPRIDADYARYTVMP
jgi:Flp pilus assembly protein TadD